jgi:hypothetical protein
MNDESRIVFYIFYPQMVRTLFKVAAYHQPAIIFIDEVCCCVVECVSVYMCVS